MKTLSWRMSSLMGFQGSQERSWIMGCEDSAPAKGPWQRGHSSSAVGG